MRQLLTRHWTLTAIIAVILLWTGLYLPGTPEFAVVQLKRAIDRRDGEWAAQYVDFDSVVRHAGYEMVDESKGGRMGGLIGRGAVELFSKPLAQIAQQQAERMVNEKAKEVQMPAGAVAVAIVLMHRNSDMASTRFRDSRGRPWEIVMARGEDGRWRVSEVKNIQEILGRPGQTRPAR